MLTLYTLVSECPVLHIYKKKNKKKPNKHKQKKQKKPHIYHQAGDDDDEYSEEEDDSIKAFSAPHVVPLLALKDVFLQKKRNLKSSL